MYLYRGHEGKRKTIIVVVPSPIGGWPRNLLGWEGAARATCSTSGATSMMPALGRCAVWDLGSREVQVGLRGEGLP